MSFIWELICIGYRSSFDGFIASSSSSFFSSSCLSWSSSLLLLLLLLRHHCRRHFICNKLYCMRASDHLFLLFPFSLSLWFFLFLSANKLQRPFLRIIFSIHYFSYDVKFYTQFGFVSLNFRFLKLQFSFPWKESKSKWKLKPNHMNSI